MHVEKLNFVILHLIFSQELEDYFYYAQLRSQGIDAMETRQVSTHIPLEEVPFVMRAMGFYPSEEKVCFLPKRIIVFTEYAVGQFLISVTQARSGINPWILNVFSLDLY